MSQSVTADSTATRRVWPYVYAALLIIAVVWGISAANSDYALPIHGVILKAKPWNEGKVHIWDDIVETPGVEANFTDLPDGTVCQRLDNQQHRLVGPPPPIYYYHVQCGDVVGYVEVDQVR